MDKSWPGGKREVSVEFFADGLRWRFKSSKGEPWQDGEPTEENWDELESHLKQLIQRGHLFTPELKLVRELRQAPSLPKPDNTWMPSRRRPRGNGYTPQD